MNNYTYDSVYYALNSQIREIEKAMLDKPIKLSDYWYTDLYCEPKSTKRMDNIYRKFDKKTNTYTYQIKAPGIDKESLKVDILDKSLKIEYRYGTGESMVKLSATLPFSYKTSDDKPELFYVDGVIEIKIKDNSDSITLTL